MISQAARQVARGVLTHFLRKSLCRLHEFIKVDVLGKFIE